MKIQAYLSFKGQCQQALNYYADLFDAKVINRQTYADKKIDVPASYRDKLQHAELKGKNVYFMAYDAAPDTPLNGGNQIHMSIEADSVKDGKQLFESLSDNGTVHHQYSVREWGYFGRCTDRFGIGWMVNCNHE